MVSNDDVANHYESLLKKLTSDEIDNADQLRRDICGCAAVNVSEEEEKEEENEESDESNPYESCQRTKETQKIYDDLSTESLDLKTIEHICKIIAECCKEGISHFFILLLLFIFGS